MLEHVALILAEAAPDIAEGVVKYVAGEIAEEVAEQVIVKGAKAASDALDSLFSIFD